MNYSSASFDFFGELPCETGGDLNCFSKNTPSGLVAVGSEDGNVLVWKQWTPSVSGKRVIDCGGDISSLAFSDCGGKVFVAVEDTLALYELNDGSNENVICESKQEKTFQGEDIEQVDIKGNFLVAGDDSGHVNILNTATWSVEGTLSLHKNLCSCVSFRPSTREVFSGGMDTLLIRWDLTKKRAKYIRDYGKILNQTPDLAAGGTASQLVNPPMVYDLALSADGQLAAAALGNGYVFVEDIPKQEPIAVMQKHSTIVSCVAFLPPPPRQPRRQGKRKGVGVAQRFVSGGVDGKVIAWSLDERKSFAAMYQFAHPINGIAVLPPPAENGPVAERKAQKEGENAVFVGVLVAGLRAVQVLRLTFPPKKS
eukprot:GCRY01001066.1.p1 GENE.GCRY01001066.1~~GCRY01001066.1.p1  ORF type:complete len:368 (+),score=74.54 GCRY01001066.1:157-1260(+)